MRTKTKMIVMVEIAVVLCSVFLVAIPAIATEQTAEKVSASEVTTTASEDDYVLGVYGNANEDDTIDMGDVVYTKLAIFGKKPKTELCDAKYDGRINVLDVIQTKLIILGKEKELTFIDDTIADTFPDGKPVTVKKPVNRIIGVFSPNNAEILKLLKSTDKIVGVPESITTYKELFPELSELPIVGFWTSIDAEKIISLDPDIVIASGSPSAKSTIDLEKKLKGTDIILVRFGCYMPETMHDNIIKLGYILDREKEAEEFIDWHAGYLSIINDRVEKLTEEEKPRVYIELWTDYQTCSGGAGRMCIMAGGINIAEDLSDSYPKVDPEWVIVQNPDIIVKVVYAIGGYDEDNPSEVRAVWDAIMNRPELAKVPAVRDEKVYVIVIRHSLTDPKYVIDLIYRGKWFHPDLFKDFDPKAIHQEYLTRFLGLDYDLDKHGVFVYHPEEHPDGK